MSHHEEVEFLGVRRNGEEAMGNGHRPLKASTPISSTSQRQIVLGDLLVSGLESAFRGYFPPFKYRSAEDRDLRGFVQALKSDDGLVSLAEGGVDEVNRLDRALNALDTHKAEVTHYTWSDFLSLLGRSMDGAVYEEGAGFVVPEEDHGKSLAEKMEPHFNQAKKALDDIFEETAGVPSPGNIGSTREDYLRQLKKVSTPGVNDYFESPPPGSQNTPSTLTLTAGSSRDDASAMEIDCGGGEQSNSMLCSSSPTPPYAVEIDPVEEDSSLLSGDRVRSLEEKIAEIERVLAAMKMRPVGSQAAVTPQDASTSTALASRSQTALHVSSVVEERMAEKARKEKRPRGDSFLRKGPMSPKQEAEVDHGFEGGGRRDVLVRAFKANLTRADLLCLRPKTWLNDEVVNMYMELLGVRDKELCKLDPSRRPSHFFSSFFLTKLLGADGYNYKGVRRWTRKIKVFEMDKIFFPVNVSNVHWCMAVVYVQQKRINYYDSMAGTGRTVTSALKLWLEDEDEDKNGDTATFEPDDWTIVGTDRATTPQQFNGSDCGAFACAFASFASDDLPFDFSQDDMTSIRRRMMWSLLNQRLV